MLISTCPWFFSRFFTVFAFKDIFKCSILKLKISSMIYSIVWILDISAGISVPSVINRFAKAHFEVHFIIFRCYRCFPSWRNIFFLFFSLLNGFLKLYFELSISPCQKIIMQLQLGNLCLGCFEFLFKSLHFSHQCFKFIVIKMIKLMYLQLNQLTL